MGYSTYYNLETINDNCETNHEIEISKLTNYYSCFGDAIKWYEHEKDMKFYSLHFPNVIFKVTGVGEEPGDYWIKYFKNGKMQRCDGIIVYPPYDESNLE